MFRIKVLLAIALGISLSAFCAQDPPGKPLYMQYCSSCHGQRLQGGNAQSLVDAVWQYGSSNNQIRHNIKYGLPHLGMPGYEESLSESQINQIVDFLKAEESAAGVSRPPTPEKLQTMDYDIRVEVLAEDLRIPWGIAFADRDTILFTERPGTLRVIQNGTLLDPVADTPQVLAEGQGGLLDVAVDPEYETNGWVYLAYSHKLTKFSNVFRRAPAMTRIVRGRIKDHEWTDEEVVYEAPHDTYRDTRHHYGCRIVFDPDGFLYFGIGDRGAQDQAQALDRPNGKIHRIHRDGKIPEDNPFADRKDALGTIYAYGIRNPQGLAVHPEAGDVWETEHGPLGGDELNLIRPGENYGWPVITYGRNYSGTIISEFEAKPGMSQPIWYWKPSTAVCGMDFYQGKLFEKWNHHLLAASLKYEDVQLLDIKNDRVLHSEVILKNAGRVRDVACGPDGAIYVVLNAPDKILRLTPEQGSK